tara:strand:+ start:205 stop:453 length:249 start_codon:yes stop_codon:yes gene_type:complete
MSFATYIEIKNTIDPYNNFDNILSGGDPLNTEKIASSKLIKNVGLLKIQIIKTNAKNMITNRNIVSGELLLFSFFINSNLFV